MRFEELYFAFIDVGSRLDEIEHAISYKNRFTDTFRFDKKIKTRGIYAICLSHDEISYFALGTKSGRVATYKDRVTFTEFLKVGISISSLIERFPKIEISNENSSVDRVPPVQTKNIYRWLETVVLDLKKWLINIDTIQATNRTIFVEVEKKDSVQLALQMANFNRNGDNLRIQTIGHFPTFLSDLNDVILTEDEMINHDMSVFGDWGKIKSDIHGMACFDKRGERLFIWNVNRKPLESVLGVDLIYYTEDYDSFVMVQYKRMKREGDKWIYRPTDSSYHKELENMGYFENLTSEISIDFQNPAHFRLDSCPFYFKLCKSSMGISKSTDSISGMYIPLNYWEVMLKHPSFVRGEKGGTSIGYHNAKRWLTRDDFTGLVQKGWIGSQLKVSSIIAKLIRGSLEGDRAITLAAKMKSPELLSLSTYVESNDNPPF